MDQIIYRVDEKDRITFMNSAWFVFAERNGMQLRSTSQLLGTRLWKHVSDQTVRHFYAVFMAKVRKTGKPVTIPFRCDSPELARYMEMTISRHNKTELEFRTTLLRETARATGELPAAKPTKVAPLIMMCIWCKNVKSTRWLRPERAVHVLNLFESQEVPLISHITCPRCESKGLNTFSE